MAEKVDIKSWFSSFFQVVPWLKNIRFIAGTVIIAFIGLTIYRAYFVKTTQQTQHADITVQSGGHITYAPVQKTEKEKKWYIPSPFVEIYVFSESDTEYRSRNGAGIRAGARWEF
jgi:exosortase/archaeosortase